MSLQIGDTAPDFSARTTEGAIRFHEWLGNGWAILFSHPKDFTPVCTTELGYMAKLAPEFAKRGCKIIGLSVDPITDHARWLDDIEAVTGHKPNYPLIGDSELKVAKALDESAGQGASDVRAKIKAEVADKLTEQLAGEPFWIRKPGTTTYGKMEISTSKDIYAVHPEREEEYGRNPFHCIMVTLTFEIGVPPKKKEAPKPADGQQPNQGGN